MLNYTAYVQATPKNLSSVEAASIPLTGCNAWDALISQAHVLPEENVLIHGFPYSGII
jgi:NADPH:quinone reductase-like Zn-dependent oxidoreductase